MLTTILMASARAVVSLMSSCTERLSSDQAVAKLLRYSGIT
jgi:hypothetical protein